MIRKAILIVLAGTMISAPAMADTWKMDKAHTLIGFTATHLVITKIHGRFKDFDGTIEFDGKNVEKGSVDVTIQMASVDTDNERRDNDLRSANFFDVEKYPVMTFKSTKITKVEGNRYNITGDLTIKDVTKEVTLDAVFNGTISDPKIGTRAGFSATGKINRMEFGIKWNNALETGILIVGNEVVINIDTELVKSEK